MNNDKVQEKKEEEKERIKWFASAVAKIKEKFRAEFWKSDMSDFVSIWDQANFTSVCPAKRDEAVRSNHIRLLPNRVQLRWFWFGYNGLQRIPQSDDEKSQRPKGLAFSFSTSEFAKVK